MAYVSKEDLANALALVAHVKGSIEAFASSCASSEGEAKVLTDCHQALSCVIDDLIEWIKEGKDG